MFFSGPQRRRGINMTGERRVARRNLVTKKTKKLIK